MNVTAALSASENLDDGLVIDGSVLLILQRLLAFENASRYLGAVICNADLILGLLVFDIDLGAVAQSDAYDFDNRLFLGSVVLVFEGKA